MPAPRERNLVGHMVRWSYLHSIDTPENRTFIDEWRQFTGYPEAMTNDPMEASWIGFKPWTGAVTAACTTDIDAENQHLHMPAFIGRMDEKNFIWPVWVSPALLAPEPWSRWLARTTPMLAQHSITGNRRQSLLACYLHAPVAAQAGKARIRHAIGALLVAERLLALFQAGIAAMHRRALLVDEAAPFRGAGR